MIRSIDIKGLRGIREGKLDDLTPLVILVGPNGSGKSTVLDAIMIGASPNPAEAIGQLVSRRQGPDRGARWLFWRGGSQAPLEISVLDEKQKERTVNLTLDLSGNDRTSISCSFKDNNSPRTSNIRIAFHPNNEYALLQTPDYHVSKLEGVSEVKFIDAYMKNGLKPLHQLVTEATESDQIKSAKEILSKLVMDLEDIRILTEGNIPVVHLIHKGRAVPVALAGDGIRLLVHLTFELATCKDGIALLEEPETHMHPGAIRQCAKAVLASIRRGVQVILTTHSLELIDSILAESADKDLELLSLYRIRLENGLLNRVRLSGSDVAFSRTEVESDLR